MNIRNLKVSAFWQAVLVVVAAYFIFDNAFPPITPKSMMIAYMSITLIGVLLYYSCEQQRWDEFKGPILSALRDDNKKYVRGGFLVFVPLLLAYTVYDAVKPSNEPPMELRQVHPAPPASVRVYDKKYDLATLENPLRMRVLEQLKTNETMAMETYNAIVRDGDEIYINNCFYCHGDLLGGKGPYAKGFSPLPANFMDVGTIAQLQESYVFWRITTGGPGLPKGGTPWNSSMPVWHEMLSEEDVWKVITFLYDRVGQVPRMWDQDISRAVTGFKDKIQADRANMHSHQIYELYCAACHGAKGAADVPVAEKIYPKPRDFTTGLFKYKTSPGVLPPRDEDIFNVIKYGLTGTSMPGWQQLLTDKQIQSLIPVIKSFDTAAAWAPEEAEDEHFDDDGRYLKNDYTVITEQEPVNGQIPYSAESIAHGEKVFEDSCKECHGAEGRGNITSGKRLKDDWENRIWPRDLTSPWTWRLTEVAGTDEKSRDQTIRNIYTRATIGLPGTPMPGLRAENEEEKDPVSLEDRWHVANYVYSLREKTVPQTEQKVIAAKKVKGKLPHSVSDEAWNKATATTVTLVPNMIKEKRLFTPLNNVLTIRTLYNNKEIAFLLEVNDRTDSRPGEPVSTEIQDESLTMYSDAFAIQFPKEEAYISSPTVEKPLFRHGEASRHTTIWYWNAGSVEPAAVPWAMLLDASGPDKKLVARESDPNFEASGNWRDGRWQVMMKRPLDGAFDDLKFSEGQFIPISFANWDGSNGEKGSKHTLTTWFWLLLPTETNYTKVYGAPFGTALGVFLLGVVLIRSQRRKTT
ncbi:hypothetical protein MNBD_GAMMA21-1953 [hydrothermal vent metagenome]|uniref:Cytochrome c domain-containing protein n=1 Tax=hydrothermal vent metagenome TaxID=652676 RepID=A0A3B1B361_9ZZZZ